jgi:hypothetical protein
MTSKRTKPKAKPASSKHPGGRPRHVGPDRRDANVFIRIDGSTADRLDALAGRARAGSLSRASVARVAVELGLDALERDPSLLFAPSSKVK